MKIVPLITEDQLNEISLKQAIAAGMIGIAGLTPAEIGSATTTRPDYSSAEAKTKGVARGKIKRDYLADPYVAALLKKHRGVAPEFASRVVQLARQHADDVFTVKDILAVVGIESEFDPLAVSALKTDPAHGLMQVRPGVWELDPSELKTIEGQMDHGMKILRKYYKKFKNKRKAIEAYNVGLTAYRKHGKRNPNHLRKFDNELALYATI